MGAEHVTRPEQFVAKLGQLARPRGKVVVYRVNRRAPMTILSGCTPMAIHRFAKKVLWGASGKDTFPVAYLMNTRSRLLGPFAAAGFRLARVIGVLRGGRIRAARTRLKHAPAIRSGHRPKRSAISVTVTDGAL
jgi:hypothetical protein